MSSNQPTFLRFDDAGTKLIKFAFDFVTENDYIGYQTVNSVSVPVIVSQNSVWSGPTPWGLLVANSTANIVIQVPTSAQMSAGYVLAANGSWVAGGGGGSAGPSGANTQVQFNDSGVMNAVAGFIFNKTTTTVSVGGSTLNSSFWSQTSNNTLFIGTVSAANVVSNAQLIANLANFPNNTQLSANLANYQPAGSYLTTVPATYVQNTDSRTLSGNLVFSGANVYFNAGIFVGANVVLNTTLMSVGNTTQNTVTNSTGFFLNGISVSSGSAGWSVKSTTYTAVNGDKLIANTAGGAFTITLPASPIAGMEVAFADSANNWVTNALTISRNGATIAGSATDLICDTQAYFRLLYSGSTWVIESTPMPSPGTGSVLYNSAQNLTSNQAAQARANLWVTKKNYILNGGMQISQEWGTTASNTSPSYVVDQFYVTWSAGVFTCAQVASPTPGGSPNRFRLTVTSGLGSVGASDYLVIVQPIEGERVADLKLGLSSAKTVTLQFGVKAPAATYSISLQNAAQNRSYPATFTIAAGEANTDVIKTITIPLDTTGTWLTDNTRGLGVVWAIYTGSTYQGTPNTWGASNYLSATGAGFNIPNGGVFELFDVGLYEGSVAPPFELPDFNHELFSLQRYWEKSYDYSMAVGTANAVSSDGTFIGSGATTFNAASIHPRYKVPKRTTPTITVYSSDTGASGKIRDRANSVDLTPTGTDLIGLSGFRTYSVTVTAGAQIALYCHWTANARL